LEAFVAASVFGEGAARICTVVAAARALEFRILVEKALRQSPTVELRLDWLANDSERHRALDWLKRSVHPKAVFIATCRRRIGGGEFAGSALEELFWLMKAKEAGCAWCDLEIETLRELPDKSVAGYAIPPKVLLSIHDFRQTPKQLPTAHIPKHGGVDAIKVAAMAESLADSLRLLRLARGSRQIVAIPMGEVGLPGRILALRAGGALVYAPIAAATAPGQVPFEELRDLYRAHQLTSRSQVFGVIGNPISHSLSPALHNSGYVAAEKDAVLVPFLVERLAEFVKAIPEFGLQGFCVTLPHKTAILGYLDDCDALAEQIAAVNTVTVTRRGKLLGSNTDYIGVLRALEGRMKLPGSRVLLFGAGGAARAAAFAVGKAGAEVVVCARRDSAARRLARAVHGGVLRRASLRREKFDAILNATPMGMHPHSESSPLKSEELNCRLVMDLIYRPPETQLLRTAAKRGIRTISGVEMFLAQGIAQWEHWMRSRAPEKAMRQAVLDRLKADERRRP
jgi:3-dehydroquinate dehydratase/shikimate dehydrogenase